LNINTSALSSISTTISGEARILEVGTEEEKWCKERHLENNTFGDQAREEQGLFGHVPDAGIVEGKGHFIEGEDVRVVVVRVREGRIADWKGGVKDWVIRDDGEAVGEESNGRGRDGLVNGV
jgi:hypothetical protein